MVMETRARSRASAQQSHDHTGPISNHGPAEQEGRTRRLSSNDPDFVRAQTEQAYGQPELSELRVPSVGMHVEMAEDYERHHSHDLTGDHTNIALLIFLYVLQGIPLGLAGSIPYLLSSRKVNYKEQAVYSLVYWPFSVKLLWAPIVDALYVRWFGRRKTWLVPTQYLLGIFMLVLSGWVPSLLGEGEGQPEGGGPVQVTTLTVMFFMLNFLAATQDIAVDGWALTMLARRNVGWASTCNTIGQTAGYFLGNIVFLALESADFCNNYLRSEPQPQGVVTLADFLWFWGLVFLVTTTVVMVMKSEADDVEEDQNICSTYMLLTRILRLKPVLQLVLILLTAKIGFAAADAVTGLKLIEEGVPREKLALLGVPMVPIQIILPLIISKYTAGPRPLNVFVKAFPARLIVSLLFPLVVWWAPSTKTAQGVYPTYFYMVVLLVYALYQVALYSMFVAQMAFNAKISDPLIGGTYMTLLNTISNFGGNWPATVALWAVDSLTSKSCQGAAGSCSSAAEQKACEAAGGTCSISVDGYYIEMGICFVIGAVWWLWQQRRIRRLQDIPTQQWTTS